MQDATRERLDQYADQDGYADRQFYFACVKEGNSTLLAKTFGSERYRKTLAALYGNDLQGAMFAFSFVGAQCWHLAVSSGVPEREADFVFDRFRRSATVCRDIHQLVDALVNLYIEYAEAVKRRKEQVDFSPKIRRICNYIANHIGEAPTVEQIADAFHMSASYLSHSFKKETGQALSSYILSERIQRSAILLLQPNASVGDVMAQMGFISQGHFSKAFKAHYGMTPGKYQAAIKKSQKEAEESPSEPAFDSAKWQQKSEQYAQEKGLEDQKYVMELVRRGDHETLTRFLEDLDYQNEVLTLLEENVSCTREAFLCVWPQVTHAAIDGGLESEEAYAFMRQQMAKLYNCKTTDDMLKISNRFFVHLAQKTHEAK